VNPETDGVGVVALPVTERLVDVGRGMVVALVPDVTVVVGSDASRSSTQYVLPAVREQDVMVGLFLMNCA
jgi:hypothetical protein